jgi:CheY-like chemotaxis protein
MPNGGQLTIETGNAWLDDAAARQRDMPAGQFVALCVSDNGIGMAPEIVARAFDPFFTTKPAGQGTGLGLSMIYGFAKQSGGQIRIYSEVGAGTTVKLYLPRHNGVVTEEAQVRNDTMKTENSRGETVLVVDDEAVVRMLVSETLTDLGYHTLEAADASAGLKILNSDVRIDLLITDVGLPGGMNGRHMVDAARRKRPHLKVLFITGYAENAAVGNGHLEPGMHVMSKPFAIEQLAARVNAIIK